VAESIELKRRDTGDRRARRRVFDRIRWLNDRLNAAAPALAADADVEIARVRDRLANRGVARRRDYFFALHDRREVERLRERLAQGAAFRV